MLYANQLEGRTIRLLRLELDTYRAPIRCHLVEASLDNLPEYEALSYVWGDPTKTEQITCDGQVHHITINAARALRRIRLGISPPKSQHGVADEDAEHHDSSSHEVSNHVTERDLPSAAVDDSKSRPYRPKFLWMDAICIDQSNGLERNHQVPLMREIYSKTKRVIVWLGDKKASGKKMTALAAVVKAVASRINRADPERYNIRSSREGDVQANTGCRSWSDAFAACLPALTSDWYTRVWCIQEILLPPESLLLFRNAEMDSEDIAHSLECLLISISLDLYTQTHQLGKIFGQASNIYGASQILDCVLHKEFRPEYFLYESGRFMASNPRDRLYGLMGLFEQILVEVDYKKSMSAVYVDGLVQVAGDGLRVLSCVYHGPKFILTVDEASWIPYWGLERITPIIWRGQLSSSWASYRQVAMVDPNLARSGTLQLDGILCGSIIKTTATLPSSGDAHDMGTRKSRLRDLILNLLRDDLRSLDLLSLAKTFMVGRAVQDDESLLSDFLAFLEIAPSEQVQAVYAQDRSHDNARTYWENCWAGISSRRAFDTEKGWVGIGPVCMEPGDVVAVFHGGVSPYVLRPVQGRPDHHYLMGDCYIHNLAGGGAYKMLGTDGVEERVFKLI
ncbi:hypothetical protein OPT61_g9288 [Boeremia exigua]|uniref:Uncharacterized protein n=1 Tax=Boeremia exigua TaxID=749465 RepID=A0ACC2HUP7_9PLEO|nr:hypothetical protein OPT61_g9288 [Boeremia exigua]